MEYFMVVVDKTKQAAFLSDTIPNLFYFRCTLLSIYEKCFMLKSSMYYNNLCLFNVND